MPQDGSIHHVEKLSQVNKGAGSQRQLFTSTEAPQSATPIPLYIQNPDGTYSVVAGGAGTTFTEYVAELDQAGPNPPVATVLSNTLGEEITFGYTTVGQFTINSPGDKFTIGKVALLLGPTLKMGTVPAGVSIATVIKVSTSTITLLIRDLSGTFINGTMVKTTLQIRIYK